MKDQKQCKLFVEKDFKEQSISFENKELMLIRPMYSFNILHYVFLK